MTVPAALSALCPSTSKQTLSVSLNLHLASLTAKSTKVKFTLVQALRLCTGRTPHRGSRGITLLFLDHGTRRGWGVNVTPRPLFTPGKHPVPIVQEAGWAPGPVWTGKEFDPRTVQPVASRYADYASRSTNMGSIISNFLIVRFVILE
jgi:hypothetical protein